MKTIKILLVLFTLSLSAQSQDIFGKWTTIDDETGEAKSIVEIYEEDGKVQGKIVEILNPNKKDALCDKCEGIEKNQPILGLQIIKSLSKDGQDYQGGTIFDPTKGKSYKCKLRLKDGEPDILRVRGYIAFFYATQYWKRVK